MSRRKAKRFKKPQRGAFTPTPNGVVPGIVRMSTALRKLRRDGHDDSAKAIEALHAAAGDGCPIHGHLPDPIIGFTGDKVLFGCPDCSGSAVRAAWEREGNVS